MHYSKKDAFAASSEPSPAPATRQPSRSPASPRQLFEVEPGARPRPPLLDEDGEAIRREFGALSEEPVQSAEDGRARDEG